MLDDISNMASRVEISMVVSSVSFFGEKQLEYFRNSNRIYWCMESPVNRCNGRRIRDFKTE